MAYVYKHIRKDTNEVFYIGIGSDDNYYRANIFKGRNEIWAHIFNKTEIDVEIIIDNVSWGDACEIEKKLINEHGRINNKTGQLANMTDGGEGTFGKILSEETKYLLGKGNRGKKRTEESKLRQSQSMKGVKKTETHRLKLKIYRQGKKWDDDVKRKISERKIGKPSWNKGIKFSEESKIKMSNSKKGKKTGGANPKSKKVINMDSGEIFNTLKEAAESIKMNYSNFKHKIKNKKINFKYLT
jgi:hypothetical protein